MQEDGTPDWMTGQDLMFFGSGKSKATLRHLIIYLLYIGVVVAVGARLGIPKAALAAAERSPYDATQRRCRTAQSSRPD